MSEYELDLMDELKRIKRLLQNILDEAKDARHMILPTNRIIEILENITLID